MEFLPELFENNERWAKRMCARDPAFFERLRSVQCPKYLWIGCSDSRVPANQIVDLPPGKMFVHRNVANLCINSDPNFQSVLTYAVEVLKVEHIIVCGHYGCGGVATAMAEGLDGLIGEWLRHVHETCEQHAAELSQIPDTEARCNRLCELNVMAQVGNLVRSKTVRRAWAEGRGMTVHGWIYCLHDGRLRDLGVSVDQPSTRKAPRASR